MTNKTIEPKKLKGLMNNSFQLFKLTPSDNNIDKLITYLQAYKTQENDPHEMRRYFGMAK